LHFVSIPLLPSSGFLGVLGGLAVPFCFSASAQEIEGRVVEYTLPNGLKFLLLRRPGAPVFAGNIRFRAGGVDEHTGTTGIAHMFEHMAFKGTQKIGTTDYAKEQVLLDRIDSVAVAFSRKRSAIPDEDMDRLRGLEKSFADSLKAAGKDGDALSLLRARTPNPGEAAVKPYVEMRDLQTRLQALQQEHAKLVTKDEFSKLFDVNGVVGMNATTGQDVTTYFEQLPANRLEFWALMESERLRTPVLREFYAERDVVAEERRMRYDNDPEGKLYESLISTAFQAHPYGLPTIGWMSDINNLTVADARKFYENYYAPGNGVAALVGDIDVEGAKQIVTKYFGRIPARPLPPPRLTREPKQPGERRVTVEFDAEPRVFIAYHKPTVPDFDDYVFDMIAYLLRDSGRSSRLYKNLIKEQKIASSVAVYQSEPGSRYDNLCIFDVTPIHPHTTAEAETALYAQLDSLKTTPVTDREMQKVKNQVQAKFIRDLASNAGLASQLTNYQIITGDWRYISNHRKVIDRITPQDVMRAAQKYFTPSNRTVATLVKTGKEN
jgi:predicted Zn-dependent peptidase